MNGNGKHYDNKPWSCPECCRKNKSYDMSCYKCGFLKISLCRDFRKNIAPLKNGGHEIEFTYQNGGCEVKKIKGKIIHVFLRLDGETKKLILKFKISKLNDNKASGTPPCQFYIGRIVFLSPPEVIEDFQNNWERRLAHFLN